MTGLFGPIVTEADVRAAAIATIRLWLPAYTDEVARQKTLTLPTIRTYGTTGNPAEPDEMPGCFVIAPGLIGKPERHGDGTHSVLWALGVGVLVADTTFDAAIATAGAYGAALRALLVQHGDLGGFAQETTWADEETRPLAYERDRAVASASLMFEVRLASVVNRFGGPLTPPADPTVPTPTTQVAGTGVTLTRSP